MNTILTIRKRLAQGYTHVYYPWEAGADFDENIKDSRWCAKLEEEAIANICSERGVSIDDYYTIEGHTFFIWDLMEELVSLTWVCVRDREAGNIIEYFEDIETARQQIREYEKTDRYEGTFSTDFYEIAVRQKNGSYARYDS